MELHLTSRLNVQHTAELERMFYFHPEQGRFTDSILEQLGLSGSPQITRLGDLLKFHLPLLPEAQTLYAVDRASQDEVLKGVIIFNRRDVATLEILHIAVSPNLTHATNDGHSPVSQFLVNELCRIGASIKGVESICLPYGRGRIRIKAQR